MLVAKYAAGQRINNASLGKFGLNYEEVFFSAYYSGGALHIWNGNRVFDRVIATAWPSFFLTVSPKKLQLCWGSTAGEAMMANICISPVLFRARILELASPAPSFS